MSFKVLESGYDLAVADILVQHASEGPLNENWNINKSKFLTKWKNKGYTFPVDKKQFLKV